MSLRSTLWALAGAAASIGGTLPASALTIFVDEDQTYRYINATTATSIGAPPANWFAPGFNDSSWFTGTAPFGNSNSIGDVGNVNGPYAPGSAPPVPSFGAAWTRWDTSFDPYLRTTFTLAAQTALTVWLAVDNGIEGLYLNGVQATAPVNLEGAAFRWEHVFDIPAAYTFAGTNTVALQLEDHGALTGFNMMITANDAATNPSFTTNPPPQQPAPSRIPEPASLAVFGFGLAGLWQLRRRPLQ
jgi:hypothetical protein